MAIWPDAVSGSMLAMKNGLTERAPFVSQVSMAVHHQLGAADAGAEVDADVVAVRRR